MAADDQAEVSIEESRKRLLTAIQTFRDVAIVHVPGNLGDDLIYAGARKLLADVQYRETSALRSEELSGEVALLFGPGGWSRPFNSMPQILRRIEPHFEQVIIMPASFDVSVKEVRDALRTTRAKVFVRERVSYREVSDLCDATLAHDCALFFDYGPYRREGRRTLLAYRTDVEAAGPPVPRGNNDIAVTCESLDEFLWTIARHELIRTDRAHVTIAAAMLGKRVEYATSQYHKVPAIVEFSLAAANVTRVEERSLAEPETADACDEGPPARSLATYRQSRDAERQSYLEWQAVLERTREEIESMVPPGCRFIFVDDERIGRGSLTGDRRAVPFLERKGSYWGPPPDDAVAISELERLRGEGVSFLIFAWPSFWWLEHYTGFRAYLESTYRTVWRNKRLCTFDLRQ